MFLTDFQWEALDNQRGTSTLEQDPGANLWRAKTMMSGPNARVKGSVNEFASAACAPAAWKSWMHNECGACTAAAIFNSGLAALNGTIIIIFKDVLLSQWKLFVLSECVAVAAAAWADRNDIKFIMGIHKIVYGRAGPPIADRFMPRTLMTMR